MSVRLETAEYDNLMEQLHNLTAQLANAKEHQREAEQILRDRLHDEVAALALAQQTIADYEDSHRMTVDDCGAPDEKHCSCVPSLRLEIKRLTAERDRLKEKIKSITRKELSGWMDDYEQGCVNGYNDAYDQLTKEGEA